MSRITIMRHKNNGNLYEFAGVLLCPRDQFESYPTPLAGGWRTCHRDLPNLPKTPGSWDVYDTVTKQWVIPEERHVQSTLISHQ